MKTYTLCIGNSDNKLTQQEWAAFCKDIERQIRMVAFETYFAGFSNSDSEFQNATWVFAMNDNQMFKLAIRRIREKYRQDSVALVEGKTEFV